MGRFRGLPAVLAMLLGGAALALAAGAVAYVVRSRSRPRSDDDPGEPTDSLELEEAPDAGEPPALGEQVAAELAETEAASEAALEFQALEGYEPAEPQATTPAGLPPLGLPVGPAARAERRLPPSARWTLMAAAMLVGALVGLMLFLLTGGTIGR